MFLRNAWYVGAWATEVGRQKLLRRTLLDEPVVFYRREDGTPVALADKCAHRHAPLSEGKLTGDNIQCPYHGLTYDPDGTCVRAPGQSTMLPPILHMAASQIEKCVFFVLVIKVHFKGRNS